MATPPDMITASSLKPLSPEETQRLSDETAVLDPYKMPIIDALKKVMTNVAPSEQALSELLTALPPEVHDVASLRFRHEIELMRQRAAASQAAAAPQPQQAVAAPQPQQAAQATPPAPGGQEKADPKEMELLAAETEKLQPHKQAIVTVLMKVANDTATPEQALQELLAVLPADIHEAAKRRFKYELGIIAQRKAAPRPPAPPRRPGAAMGVVFDMAAAILLMATGTYEKIRDLMRKRPDLVAQVKQLGARMLKNGVTPDMAMVEKLQRIILQAQKFEKEKQEALDQQKQ